MKRRVMRKGKGGLLAGRQILWMLYQSFRTNKSLGHINTIVDLWDVKWRGDGQIEAFKNEWEMMAETMPHKTSKNTMATLLYTQMIESNVLKNKMDKYRKQYP